MVLDLLRLAREAQVHTCVETCGFAPLSLLEQAARWVDLFLYDIKLTDPALHRQWTGVSNDRILENLRALDKMGAKTVLRCPVIPGVNDTLAHFQGVAKIANSLTHLQEIHLEPYHPLGVSKARRLGRESLLEGTASPRRLLFRIGFGKFSRWCGSTFANPDFSRPASFAKPGAFLMCNFVL